MSSVGSLSADFLVTGLVPSKVTFWKDCAKFKKLDSFILYILSKLLFTWRISFHHKRSVLHHVLFICIMYTNFSQQNILSPSKEIVCYILFFTSLHLHLPRLHLHLHTFSSPFIHYFNFYNNNIVYHVKFGISDLDTVKIFFSVFLNSYLEQKHKTWTTWASSVHK